MTKEERLSRRWFEEGWGQGKPEVFRELAPQKVVADMAIGRIEDLDEFFAFREELLGALPDLEMEVEDVLTAEGKSAVRWRLRGTHSGEGFGLSATGRKIEVCGTTWLQVEGDQLVGAVDTWDLGGMLAELRGEGRE